jgi:hypothetical protein
LRTIIVRFKWKPTVYRQTMKRRIEKQFNSLGFAVGLATACNGRGSYYDSGVRKTFFIDTSKGEIVYELDFDDTWTNEQIETAFRFIERIAKVSFAHLTRTTESDTIHPCESHPDTSPTSPPPAISPIC